MPWATSAALGSRRPRRAGRAGRDRVARLVQGEHDQVGAQARRARAATWPGSRSAPARDDRHRRPAPASSRARSRRRPSRRSRDAASAAAKPTMPGTFSVPERWPASWPPPQISGGSRHGSRAISAPTPLGPLQLVGRERHRLGAARRRRRSGARRRPARRRRAAARPARRRDRGQLGDRLDHAGDVVRPHRAGEAVALPHQLGERVGVDHAVAVDRRPRDLEALPLELLRPARARPGARSRCTRAGPAAGREAEHRLVVGLGAARGEDDLARLGAEQLGHRPRGRPRAPRGPRGPSGAARTRCRTATDRNGSIASCASAHSGVVAA